MLVCGWIREKTSIFAFSVQIDELEIMGSGFSGTDIITRLEQVVFSDGTTLDFTQGLVMADSDDAHYSYGSILNDQIDGRGGNDTLYGYAGNDTLTGGSGNDNLYGGTGDDTYIYATDFGSDTLTENTGEALIRCLLLATSRWLMLVCGWIQEKTSIFAFSVQMTSWKLWAAVFLGQILLPVLNKSCFGWDNIGFHPRSGDGRY